MKARDRLSIGKPDAFGVKIGKKNLSKGLEETQILNELNNLVEDGKTVVLATVVELSLIHI